MRIASLALLLVLASTAHSYEKTVVNKKISKKASKTNPGDLKNFIKSNTALPSTQISFSPNEPHNLNDIKPPQNADFFNIQSKDQTNYEAALDVQIKELYTLTEKFKKKPNRGELWLRLAELYIEKANMVEDRIQTDFDKKLNDFQTGKIDKMPVLNLDPVRDYNNKSITLYEWFLRDFPNDEKVDQALFYLAYEYFEVGKIEEGIVYYKRLVKNHPESRFSLEAHFAIAEYYFEKEKWHEALSEYAFFSNQPNNALYKISTYKSAWCLFRTGKVQESIAAMDTIIKSAGDSTGMSTSVGKAVDNSRLETEASKDIIIFYAETEDMDKALNYLKTIGEKEWPDGAIRLAYRLSSKGYLENSRKVFKYIISLNPSSEKNFEYQHQIVKDFFFHKNIVEFKKELYLWVNQYSPNSEWFKKQTNKEMLQKSADLSEQTLRNYILQQHQTAQNSRGEESRLSTKEGYEAFFKYFPNSVHSHEMHFFYGELLFDMKDYSAAANQYETVVKEYPKSKHFEAAANNLLIAVDKQLPEDDQLKNSESDFSEPLALKPEQIKFIEVGNWYIEKVPQNQKAAEIKYRIGLIYYLMNHLDKAETEFKYIVQKYPKTKFSEHSANLLLDIYNIRKDYAGLEKVGQDLLQDQSIANTKLGDDIKGVVERASFVKAQSLEQKQNYIGAADLYKQFAEQNPSSNLMAAALFNAAVNYEKSGEKTKALNYYEKTLSSNSAEAEKLKLQSKKLLVKLYQQSGQFEKASSLYTDLIKESPAKDPLTINYKYNLALMHELLNKPELAIEEYNMYRSEVKDSKEKTEILFKVSQLSRELNNQIAAEKNYTSYVNSKAVSPQKKAEALYWSHTIQNEKFNYQNYKRTENKIKSIVDVLSGAEKLEAAIYLAKLKLTYAEDLYSKLAEIKIAVEPSKQRAAVEGKLEGLNKLNITLGEIIKLDTPYEIVTSLNLFARANTNVVESFNEVPVPTDLDEESKALYLEEIKKITSPIEIKALESHKLAVQKSRDLGVYNEAYLSSLAYLNKLNKAEYPMLDEKFEFEQSVVWLNYEIDKKVKLNNLGLALLEKSLAKIKEESIAVLLENPDDVVANNALALCNVSEGRLEAASLLLNRALKQKPDSVEVMNNLAILKLKKKEKLLAVKQLVDLNRKNPDNVIVAMNTAQIFFENHDYKNVVLVLEPLKKKKALNSDGLKLLEKSSLAMSSL